MSSVGRPKSALKQMRLHFSASWFIHTGVSMRQLTLQHKELEEYIAEEFENILDAFFPGRLGDTSCSIRPQRERTRRK
jgi:hypothetical protein